jgi:hypothetical protein
MNNVVLSAKTTILKAFCNAEACGSLPDYFI